MTATATERCPKTKVGFGHTWMRSTSPTGSATCAWCSIAADPIADLDDPAPAARRARQRAEAADQSLDLFEATA